MPPERELCERPCRGFVGTLTRREKHALMLYPALGEPGVPPREAETGAGLSGSTQAENRGFAGKTVQRVTTLQHAGVNLDYRLNVAALPRSRRW